MPVEARKPAKMTLTLIALDRPTDSFAAMFTRNAFPGAPVIIGRRRLDEPTLGAVIVNNKVSNVCAPDGVAASERICGAVAERLKLKPAQVLPSSTGVIGWQLPVDAMVRALPDTLSPTSVLPAAEGIMTTDLYSKVRRAQVGAGSIVGIAKGAGMVEPNMATMLVYLLTDLAVPRAALRATLARAVDASFNLISVDSDTSTSDTVLALSSGVRPCPDLAAFEEGLATVCRELAEDIVRNGEGVHHVIRVTLRGAPAALGKAIVNSPLVKTAICGNDPNVGRIVAAIGKYAGAHPLDLGQLKLRLGGTIIFEGGVFRLDPAVEEALVRHLKDAELYEKAPIPAFPAHERCVELEVDLGAGDTTTVLGGDLTHEYISENADYRS